MSSTTPLTDSINNLTTYANSVTGASDTNLSDAVATLASGYGGGSGSITTETGTVVGNGTHTINFAVSKIPDIILMYSADYQSGIVAVADRAHRCTLIYSGFVGCSSYSAANSTDVTNSGCATNSGISATSTPSTNKAGYTSGKLYIHSGNNSNLWSTSITYKYILYYL